MNGDKKEHIVLTPDGKAHTHTLIWLHGLGDSAQGFVGLFLTPQVTPVSSTTKVVLPTAPTRPVSLNGGAPCTSWYDIKSLERNRPASDLYNRA